MENQEPALYCDSTAVAEPERTAHFALGRALLGNASERLGLADGYAYRLPSRSLTDVALFIRNERRCCGFLTFEVRVPAGEDTIWLRVTGPAGTRAVLDQAYSNHQEG